MMTTQWSNKSFCTLLRKNGYTFIRQKGNHQIWSKDNTPISIPSVKINCMLAKRLIKENGIVEE